MRELKNQKKDNIVNVKQTIAESQRKKIGSISLNKGHRLYQYDTLTRELTEVTFDKKTIVITSATGYNKVKEVTMKESVLYVGALNKKNAAKRLFKQYGLVV